MKKLLSLVLALAIVLACFNLGVSFVSASGSDNLIKGATLSLGASLNIDYYADLAGESIDDVTMRFTNENGAVKTVNGVFDETYQLYKFTYTGINPQCMTDTIKAELLLDGETVLAEKDDYSVKAYCDSLASKEAGELSGVKNVNLLRKLLADTLVYGKEAQLKQNYKLDDPADASGWINNYKTSFVSPTGVKTIEGNQDPENYVKSASLNMANVNRVYFRFVLADENVTITLNDKVVDRSELVEQEDGSFILYTEDIIATEFDKVFTLELVKDGVAITTVKYNLNAYIQAKYSSSSVGPLVQALNNYGVSAKNYQAMKNGNYNGDYDLDDEDDLLSGGTTANQNLIPAISSDFNKATALSDTAWVNYNNSLTGTYGIASDDNDGKCIYFDTVGSWQSLALDLSQYIKKEGRYTISFKYKVTGACSESSFSTAIRSTAENSFIKLQSGNYYYGLTSALAVEEGVWESYTATFDVSDTDIENAGKWEFCLHSIKNASVTAIFIDDFTLIHTNYSELAQSVENAVTWYSNEAVFVSDKWYNDAYREVTMDLILTNGHVEYKIPCFWDGGRIWRARFVCPDTEFYEEWSYTTTCSDETNTGLNNSTETLITCTQYADNLDIYKHGFITTEFNKKYFTYNDGTPFFYLGDTHWRFTDEPLKVVEDVVETRKTQGFTVMQTQGNIFGLNNGVDVLDLVALKSLDAKFKYIAEEGLVNAHSQFFFPDQMDDFITNMGKYHNNPGITLTDTSNAQILDANGDPITLYGVDEDIIMGEQDMFYSDGEYLTVNLYDFTSEVKAELERLSRYWVARYSSYPVMWTLGQEVDNDFFFGDNMATGIGYGHSVWGKANNPYKLVAEYINKYDPYKSALTAHQESAERFQEDDSRYSQNGDFWDVFGKDDAVDRVTSHTWYASQWKVKFDADGLEKMYNAPKNYWNNTDKVVINYEGYYDGLETKEFGARAQGWLAYLSGMYGYGWGAQGTWEYNGNYLLDATNDVSDGVNTISQADRINNNNVDHALTRESAVQMGYMRNFFEQTVGEWNTLIPRFDDTNYLTLTTGYYNLIRKWSARAAIASDGDVESNKYSSKIVVYFLNFSDSSIAGDDGTANAPNATAGKATGTLKNLTPSTPYNYIWFNPSDGTATQGTFTSTASGTWSIGEKANRDMVLYVYKQ